MTEREPKICLECDCQPFLSENGFCENGCCFEPKHCALVKARRMKAIRREAMKTGKTVEQVVTEWDKAESDRINEDYKSLAKMWEEGAFDEF